MWEGADRREVSSLKCVAHVMLDKLPALVGEERVIASFQGALESGGARDTNGVTVTVIAIVHSIWLVDNAYFPAIRP